MLKKKLTALLAVLLMTIAFVSVTYVYAAEGTNLKLEYEELQMIELPAGAMVHMEVELSLKKGYCIEPVFSVTPESYLKICRRQVIFCEMHIITSFFI